MTIARGKLIGFDGIDGSGKTTLARYTSDLLTQHGIDHQLLATVGAGPLGQMIRKYLFQQGDKLPYTTDVLLLALCQDETIRFVKTALMEGNWVVLDRTPASFFAYQVTRHQSLIAKTIYDKYLVSALPFDLFVYCNPPVENAVQRKKQQGDTNFLDHLSLELYHTLNQAFSTAYTEVETGDRLMIDTAGDLEHCQDRVKNKINLLLQS